MASDCGVSSASCSGSFDSGPAPVMTPLGRLVADKSMEGTIKLVVNNVSQLRQKSCTSYHTFASLPWRIAAKTECSKRTNNNKFFSVYIDCNPESESTLWSCEATVEFKLVAQSDGVSDYTRSFTNKFNYNSNNWGFPSFMEWTELLSNEKGFVKNDRVVVEARINVHKPRGVRVNHTFDFSTPSTINDSVVVIDGVRLNVNRHYLSLYSPVFQALFFGEWRERSQDEIPVEDVILEEFTELLHVIYPSHKPVTAENVEFLLELGDKYEVNYVMDQCEAFLTRTDEISAITKLVWADQYNLSKLQDACMKSLRSTADIKALKSSDEYKSLSDTTKAALLEKILKLMG